MRVAIAEKCGWTNTEEGWWSPKDRLGMRELMFAPPNYPADLNAMHEAEKVLKDGPWDTYIEALDSIVNPIWRMTKDFEQWCIARATAAQRAEAFCRVFWPEKFN